MRLDWRGGAGASSGRHDVVFRDAYQPDRLGWREVVATASGGASLSVSSVPATSASDELRKYPDDLLRSPLHVTEARLTVVPGAAAGAPSAFAPSQVTRAVGDRFAALIEADQGRRRRSRSPCSCDPAGGAARAGAGATARP